MAKTSDIPDIPEFKILGRIGGGSYGEVFLARSVTGNFRAVKVVRREDFERERTFEREFEGIQHYEKVSQDHPGLVDVLHAGRNDKEGYYYYVMELADDVETGSDIDIDHYTPRTLASDLKHHRLRSVRECVEVGSLMADALGHLHAAGLTHRDVKPSNVLVTEEGRVCLIDFGIARVAATDDDRVTSTGVAVGSPAYMAPEQLRGEPCTPATDVYAVGVMAFELLTGEHPFASGTALATAAAIERGTTRAPSQLRSSVPAVLDAIVMTCLSRDPAQR
ncbi:MAG: serine/threonine protein kinase, partial [Verrucomicrobiae bacterium]|nr:serine/threonine protein kinase [Verrucomicrobiae bacterium]